MSGLDLGTSAHEDLDRLMVAAEVLELGQALFDALVEAAADRADSADTAELPPVADIQAAADEFFVALRLLLGLEDGAS